MKGWRCAGLFLFGDGEGGDFSLGKDAGKA
jgi:hypothetical protein